MSLRLPTGAWHATYVANVHQNRALVQMQWFLLFVNDRTAGSSPTITILWRRPFLQMLAIAKVNFLLHFMAVKSSKRVCLTNIYSRSITPKNPIYIGV